MALPDMRQSTSAQQRRSTEAAKCRLLLAQWMQSDALKGQLSLHELRPHEAGLRVGHCQAPFELLPRRLLCQSIAAQ
eukprot:365328-Chlamydomonas_euryale.AAC.11